MVAREPQRDESAGIEDAYELTPLQQGMLVDTLREPGAGLYVNQAVELVADVDPAALASAWQQVVDRHTILRTSFLWAGLDSPRQRVHRAATVSVVSHDWRRLAPGQHEARLREFLAADRRRGFDLATPPLLRLALLRRAEPEHYVVVTHHHLLLDGWSRPLLLDEVERCYQAARRGQRADLAPARPFGDYVAWLRANDTGEQRAFWRSYLGGRGAATPLPFDGSARGGEGGDRFGEWRIRLPAAPLQGFARGCRVTPSTLVTAAWALVLSRHAADRDVVFGILAAGRPPALAGAESMIGMLMNSVPLRVRVDGRQSVAGWLDDLQRSQAELRAYEHSALIDVRRWSELPAGAALFESIVVDQTAGNDRRGVTRVVPPVMRQSVPLVLGTVVADDTVALTLTYDSRRFDMPSIVRLAEQLRTVLGSMIEDPDRAVDALPMMGGEERGLVVVEWNRTAIRRRHDLCLHQLFEAQAARTPDRPAVGFQDRTLTYRELDARANVLATRLAGVGVAAGDPVGVCIERSLPAVIGMLAVLKAGGAVLPLDPGYPANRVRYMLGDARAKVLLIQSHLAAQLGTDAVDYVVLIDGDAPAAVGGGAEPLPCRTHPEEPALLLYTSGSTGTPKGVAIPHRSAVNRLLVDDDRFEDGEALCAKTSLSFIDSVWELFGAWHHGLRTTLVADDDVRDTPRLVDALAAARATRIVLVPSLLRSLLAAGVDLAARLPRLRHWISSGEPLPPDLCRDFARTLPDAVLTNLYGITEVWDATRCDSREQVPGTPLPIGRPMGNVRAYVLDDGLEPVPIGVAGELYLAGDGLARGYWRRPAQTAERFVPDPFSGTGGGRLYRTGDRARWRADGNIEHLGRVDDQIKLHGYRIEPGEIETALRRHGGVADVAVVPVDNGDRLAAFIVSRGCPAPRAEELRTLLRRRLPEHMVPSALYEIDRLPRTPNGKIDRRSLAAGTGGQVRTIPHEPARPVRTPTERAIAAVWTEVLGVDAVGADSDFFDLGGHSLLAMRTVSRLSDALGVDIPPSAVFEQRTVAALAARLEAPAADPVTPPARLHARQQGAGHEFTAPASAAQEGLWFLDRLSPGSTSQTIPAFIRLRGPIDRSALRAALTEVVRRHESLRTTFEATDGRPSQVIHAAAEIELPVLDVSAAADRDTALRRGAADLARLPWDLSTGPLLRARLLSSDATHHVLAVTMHHIITDGASMGIFAHELAAIYRAYAAQRPCPLPEPPLQFADFASWQQAWLRGPQGARQRDHWRRALSDVEPLPLPTDRPPQPVPSFRGKQRTFELSAETTERLRRLARDEGVTTFIVVLAVYQLLLSRWCGQDDITVGTPVANRNRPEFERVIGFFVNTVGLRTSIAGDPTFRDLVQRARRTCLEAYDHGDFPFDKVVEAVNPIRVLGRHPIFQVLLVYQGPALGAVELPGVSWRPEAAELETTNFDLLLLANESAATIAFTLRYDADLFDAPTIAQATGRMRRLAEQAVVAPDERVSTYRLLSPSERRRILNSWSGADRRPAIPPIGTTCVHDRVTARADEAPERTAVRWRGEEVTFGELDRRSAQLAGALQARGVGPEVVVGLCLGRTPATIVAILATLKAGGAFVVLDPAHPAERLDDIVRDSGAALVLTAERHRDAVATSPAPVVVVDDAGGPRGDSLRPLRSAVGPRNLAYLVYTSGSTGEPRGVQVEHGNLAGVIAGQLERFGIDSGSRVLQSLSLSFDAAIGEIFRALVAGATLVLADDDPLLPGAGMVDALRDQRITVAAITPASLALLPCEERSLPALRTLVVGGEQCPAELAERWRAGRRLINGYGPTETTIGATVAVDWPRHTPPPLGRPLPGVRVHVLDRAMQPVPVGVPGELFIGGVGVTRGYRDRPAATAERFVPDPFGGGLGARLYRTGDSVRWSSDGTLEFIGRLDQQVKIRGHRVEPGEIEAALRGHEQVAQCAVDARQLAGSRQLVAYVTAAPGQHPSSAALRGHLGDRLPDHLVPTAVVVVDSLPLNVNGKVDRAALPAPTAQDRNSDDGFVAPRSEREAALARIWEEVLELEQVGIHANFFALGGDSLSSIRVVARAAEAGIEISPQALFRYQTIAELATHHW